MIEVSEITSPHPVTDQEAITAAVFLTSCLMLMHSLWVFLELVNLSKASGWLCLGVGLVSLASATAWSYSSDFREGVVLRCLLLLALIATGPICLYTLGNRIDAPATLVLLVLICVVSLGIGPAFALFLRWLRGLLMGTNQAPEVSDDSPMQSWLLRSAHVLLPLCLLTVAKPYIGRLGAHVLIGASLTLWLFPLSVYASKRFHMAGWFGAHILVFWLGFGWPWPQLLADSEILYTDQVAGQSVTVHARRAEKHTYYTVTTKRSVIHGTITAYRQAEMLTHPAMAMAKVPPKRILLLGSEDGAVLREIAKYKHKKYVSWTPLFPSWRGFFASAPLLGRGYVPTSPTLEVSATRPLTELNPDAIQLLVGEHGKGSFDLIIADFPKAYNGQGHISTESYKRLLSLLSPKGIIAAQLASPYTQASYYWCLIGQWTKAGAHVVPYQLMPSLYQDFGYALIAKTPLAAFSRDLNIPVNTQYLRASQPMSVLARFAKESTPHGRAKQASCRP